MRCARPPTGRWPLRAAGGCGARSWPGYAPTPPGRSQAASPSGSPGHPHRPVPTARARSRTGCSPTTRRAWPPCVPWPYWRPIPSRPGRPAGRRPPGSRTPLANCRSCAAARWSRYGWPTTPLILRESTAQTSWEGGTLPAGTVFALHTPYLHRAEPAAPYGDSFAPRQWTEETGQEARANPALVPFSSGPAGCPGENLVLFTVSTLLAALVERHQYTLASHPQLRPSAPIPATLDHFALAFRVSPL
ncbi:cytochrome P450 [Streptomyces sp. B15]|uniref:cytochrome P450 n=1 Tax=Streptomyces sp. B15 TaxID=1537797 RepID=UPI0027DCB98F|nr:cytochrome P450 [Streptomyces sp. B15]